MLVFFMFIQKHQAMILIKVSNNFSVCISLNTCFYQSVSMTFRNHATGFSFPFLANKNSC
ncbi:hypothetical protein UP85_25545 [Escherichia coli]|nr:hypothetical protein UP85_25545 [Escherichia coli]